MAKYIDADKLKDAWLSGIYIPPRCGKTLNSLIASVVTFIDDIPAADVVEIKRGEWVKGKKEKLYYGYGMNGFYDYPVKCSKCQYDLTEYGYQETEYCPNCGAKMGSGGADNV